MDVKAMAKSKRSHTKHHQARKPHQHHPKDPLKSPAVAVTSSANGSGKEKEARQKTQLSRTSLPSNWDRYSEALSDHEEEGGEEVLDPASDEPSRLATNKAEEIKPKSKGADFGSLISRAKAESQSTDFASFDDLLPDYCQGFESMLAARGEYFVSWVGPDNFLDDEATTVQEAPFLSLDLEAVAEQLSKVDLAKRLFIDPNLLPLELLATSTKEDDSKIPVEMQRTDEDKTAATTSAELNTEDEVFSPDATSRISLEIEQNDRLPRFEASAAESELDMLLNSFAETKLFGSSVREGCEFPLKWKSSVHEGPSQTSAGQVLYPSTDDAVDDLLRGTPSLMSKDGASQQLLAVNSISIENLSSSHLGTTESKVFEDFDSWIDTL